MKSPNAADTQKGDLVVRRLEDLYGDVRLDEHDWRERCDPFWLIVETILSQNTTAANSRAAFRRLTHKYNTLNELADADLHDVGVQIKQAGLYAAKAKSIVSLAKEIEDEFEGNTWLLLAGPYELARKRLLNVTGIGEKTADVVLLFARGFQIIPVDTHIFRVSRRIGIAPQKGGYDVVKDALEKEIPPAKRQFAHVALIKFGREICNARAPQHWRCPLTDICNYYKEATYAASKKADGFEI
ncbi:MAG: endonuclease III domain-containing protein [Halobacteriota archaeon]